MLSKKVFYMRLKFLIASSALALGLAAMQRAEAAVVTFDIDPDLAVIPATLIPGGNFVGGAFTYSDIKYDFDGGGLDLNIRTSRAAEGETTDQLTVDGIASTPPGGSNIVTKGTDSFLNTPFAFGDIIGDGLDEANRNVAQFQVLSDGGTTNFVDGTTNYLGLRFASGNYGYVAVDFSAAANTFTFTGGAYEDTGAPIVAGVSAVPEPSIIGLSLVAGAGMWWRRRKKPAGKV